MSQNRWTLFGPPSLLERETIDDLHTSTPFLIRVPGALFANTARLRFVSSSCSLPRSRRLLRPTAYNNNNAPLSIRTRIYWTNTISRKASALITTTRSKYNAPNTERERYIRWVRLRSTLNASVRFPYFNWPCLFMGPYMPQPWGNYSRAPCTHVCNNLAIMPAAMLS